MTKQLAKQLIEDYLKYNEPPIKDVVLYREVNNGVKFNDTKKVNIHTYKGLKAFLTKKPK